jgi:hypothetical protein
MQGADFSEVSKIKNRVAFIHSCLFMMDSMYSMLAVAAIVATQLLLAAYIIIFDDVQTKLETALEQAL